MDFPFQFGLSQFHDPCNEVCAVADMDLMTNAGSRSPNTGEPLKEEPGNSPQTAQLRRWTLQVRNEPQSAPQKLLQRQFWAVKSSDLAPSIVEVLCVAEES